HGVHESIAALSLQGNGIAGTGAPVNSPVGGTVSKLTVTGGTVLTGNTTIGVLQGATPLELDDPISGNFALTEVGAGILTFHGANTFSGGLTVASGGLNGNAINNAGTHGPPGENPSVTLGASMQRGALVYTGASSASTNMPFVLATGGTGEFDTGSFSINLTLNGTISGGGALFTQFSTLILGGNNTFTGGVDLHNSELRLANPGALNS